MSSLLTDVAVDARLLKAAQSAAPPATRKVLHLINGEHYAGAERVQDLLSLRLPELGFDPVIVCLKPNRFKQMRIAQHLRCIDLPMAFRFDLRPAKQIAQLIRDEGFSLIHTHTPRSALVGQLAAKRAGVPHVHHVHSPTSSDSNRGWRDHLNAWIERRSIRSAAGIIAVSQSLAQYARQQHVHPARIHVVPNGVPIVGPLEERSDNDAFTLGMVALFRPRKGLEVLLEALAALRSEGHNVRLRAIGTFETPAYECDILNLVEQRSLQDAIQWTGFQRNVQAELARIDMLAVPSLYGEGLPMVVLEAMAAGVPLVASRVEGVPEAVRDGLDGLIVEPNNPAALARGVVSVLNGEIDLDKLRRSAHARQAAHFSDESMARGVAHVYRGVLG